MYTHDVACIFIGGEIMESFNINQGVKQGFILSTLLFNMFLSDLPDPLDQGNCNPVHVDGTKTLNSLIWADDLLIVSETECGLHIKMLENLEKYTKTNMIRENQMYDLQ